MVLELEVEKVNSRDLSELFENDQGPGKDKKPEVDEENVRIDEMKPLRPPGKILVAED